MSKAIAFAIHTSQRNAKNRKRISLARADFRTEKPSRTWKETSKQRIPQTDIKF